MNRNKKLTEEQVNAVIENAEKEKDIYYDVSRGHFCLIIKTLYDPYIQPKYRKVKSYKRIDSNEIEFITKDNVVINITYSKEKHNSFAVHVNNKAFTAQKQKTILEVLEFCSFV